MGTQNGMAGANGDIDMSWIPSQNLVSLTNSGSPKQSPRQRKAGKRREDQNFRLKKFRRELSMRLYSSFKKTIARGVSEDNNFVIYKLNVLYRFRD